MFCTMNNLLPKSRIETFWVKEIKKDQVSFASPFNYVNLELKKAFDCWFVSFVKDMMRAH